MSESPVSEDCNFIKEETLALSFYCEFCEIFKNTSFTEHLRPTASEPFNVLTSLNSLKVADVFF